MVVRWALLACAVVLLSSCGAGVTDDPPRAVEANHPSGGTALSQLATLTVKGRAPRTGYERDKFGDGWSDVDHNGCDTRNDILRRDLSQVAFKARTRECVVSSGVLVDDPYTGKDIRFVRGGRVEIDIDHVVALSDAWQKGAFGWPTSKRVAFANDPLNLLAVDASANRQKGDGDAATWLPANKGARCAYVAHQVGVKAKYDLWITSAEHDAIDRVLRTCPSEPAAVDASPAASPAAATDPRFDTCAEAEDAGYGPYVRGKDPEYDWYRDTNHDGTVCG
ncbi:GmrSD restriction endonuclease domain-containing protein [Flindersiella endophytica]